MSEGPNEPGVPPRADGASFPETRWTLLNGARDGGEWTRASALETLCRVYRAPVLRFFQMRADSPEDADDLVQGFFADLLSRPFLHDLDPAKGRFRSFLLASARHYLSKDLRRRRALKRGGGLDHVPFSDEGTEGAGDAPWHAVPGLPDEDFDRAWALALLESVLASLQREYESKGQPALFEELKGRITCREDTGEACVVAAARLGMEEGALKVAVHRFRRRYRKALRAAVARTLDDDAEVDEEIAWLMRVLSA